MSVPVLVVPTGVANLASVFAGLRRAGGEPRLARGPEEVSRADRVVLPGVGAFGPAMTRLRAGGWDKALLARVAADRPLLAVCLGLHLLTRGSEETPGVAGLGVLDAEVVRLSPGEDARVPHMGWNKVIMGKGRPFPFGIAYYAHGYGIRREIEDCGMSWTVHRGLWMAAAARGALRAFQFHPELSGPYGAARLEEFVRPSTGVTSWS